MISAHNDNDMVINRKKWIDYLRARPHWGLTL